VLGAEVNWWRGKRALAADTPSPSASQVRESRERVA
jgi:hypothetical protein